MLGFVTSTQPTRSVIALLIQIAIPKKLLLPKTIAPPHHQKMIALQDQLQARRSH